MSTARLDRRRLGRGLPRVQQGQLRGGAAHCPCCRGTWMHVRCTWGTHHEDRERVLELPSPPPAFLRRRALRTHPPPAGKLLRCHLHKVHTELNRMTHTTALARLSHHARPGSTVTHSFSPCAAGFEFWQCLCCGERSQAAGERLSSRTVNGAGLRRHLLPTGTWTDIGMTMQQGSKRHCVPIEVRPVWAVDGGVRGRGKPTRTRGTLHHYALLLV